MALGSRLRLISALVGLLGLSTSSLASGLFSEEPQALLRGETISIEPFVGYLRGTSGEYVYNSARPGQKLSQLDWSVNALAVGARVAVRPLDWLTVRGRFFATVASDGSMTDYDWLAGYFGRDSWTHKSVSPDTNLGRAWQGDVSVSAAYYSDEDLALTVIGGFRRYDVKYSSRGGSFIYSVNGFRDTVGNLPGDRIGIAYRQVWDTPYLGLGAFYNGENWSVSAEVIGSPFVMSRDKDFHALRNIIFKEDFDTTGMVGLNAGVEYRLTPLLSLAGRVEYTRYLLAKGGTTLFDGNTGTTVTYPKPAAGADAETLLISAGVKAKL
jgi:outer membrane protease